MACDLHTGAMDPGFLRLSWLERTTAWHFSHKNLLLIVVKVTLSQERQRDDVCMEKTIMITESRKKEKKADYETLDVSPYILHFYIILLKKRTRKSVNIVILLPLSAYLSYNIMFYHTVAAA